MEEPQPIKFATPNLIVTTAYTTTTTSTIAKTTCSWVNEKGSQSGQSCDKPTFNNNKYCSAHTAVDLRRKRSTKSKPNETFSELFERCSESKTSHSQQPPLRIIDDHAQTDEEDEEDDIEYETPAPQSPPQRQIDDAQIVSILQAVVTILAQIRLK